MIIKRDRFSSPFIRQMPFIVLALFLCFTTLSNAQPIVGFWGVDEVLVGGRNVTPVAKWFKINEDSTFYSGNGWLKNSFGTWSYNTKTYEFKPENKNGIRDEFGAFKVSFAGDKMLLEREEDGMDVVVTLSKISKMPMSPADSIAGLWDLSVVRKGAEDITSTFDPDDQQYFFIRRDRLFRIRNPDGSTSSGYWHMDGHSPKFFLVDYNKEVEDQVYMVSFQKDLLIMEQQGGENLILTCRRINQFPK